MSSPTSKIKALWKSLRDKAYRDAFTEAHVENSVASQIFLMRQDRGWSQADLACRADMRQSRISVLEDSCTGVSLTTLRRLASAFDVGLTVRFDAYSDIVGHVAAEAQIPPKSFENDSIDRCSRYEWSSSSLIDRGVQQFLIGSTGSPAQTVSYPVGTPIVQMESSYAH